MKNQNFTTTLLVDNTPEEAFNAIRNVRGWWSGLHAETFEGGAEKVGDEFTFYAGGGAHYSKQKLIELNPYTRIAWLVTDSRLSFVENEKEWTGTQICFDISTQDDKTKIVFTHLGLVPEFECYGSCAPAWTQYVQQQLFNWITTGKAAYSTAGVK